MNKMKKAVEKALESSTARNHPSENKSRTRVPGPSHVLLMPTTPKQTALQKNYQDIKDKQMQVQEYEDTVHKLVQAMRVSDLRQCPKRFDYRMK